MQPEPRSDPTPLPEGVHCPDCGYDVRGLASVRCPECGFGLDAVRVHAAPIPWALRRRLGVWRAYWRTVRLVTWRPRRFCVGMAPSAEYRDARAFCWFTLAWAYLPILSASAVALVRVDMLAPLYNDAARSWLGLLQVIVLALLAGGPGMASYACHAPRTSVAQQNRAIALSYYAWAPLAWTFATLPVLVAAVVLWPAWAGLPLLLVACGIYVLAVVLVEYRLTRFVRHALELRSAVLRAAFIAFRFLLVVGILLLSVLVALIVFYVCVMVYTVC